jgi:hypothetical protein
MITGARASGFQKLGLDAGVLIEDFKTLYDTAQDHSALIDSLVTAMDSSDCLGITRGGNHFVSEADQRQIDFDGSRVRFKGDFVKDTVQPRIETTLLEFSLENLRRIMPSSNVTTVGGKTVVRERLRIESGDYMKSLSWVRERSDGAIVIFTLFNPMNTGSVDITGTDKNEGEMKVTFTGFNDDFKDMVFAPYEMVIFEA